MRRLGVMSNEIAGAAQTGLLRALLVPPISAMQAKPSTIGPTCANSS